MEDLKQTNKNEILIETEVKVEKDISQKGIDLDKCRLVAVIGDVDSGKTNLAVHLLRSYKGKRKIYTYGYPTKIDNFTVLPDTTQLDLVQDGIIFIDELHKYFKLYDKNSSREFIELVSLSAHNNNTIIFTTQLSQNITKTMEAFVDGFCITHIHDLSTLKNGSRTKKVIQDSIFIGKTSRGLYLNKGQYISKSIYDGIGEGGVVDFPFQDIGKDWKGVGRNTQKNAQEKFRDNTQDTAQENKINRAHTAENAQ